MTPALSVKAFKGSRYTNLTLFHSVKHFFRSKKSGHRILSSQIKRNWCLHFKVWRKFLWVQYKRVKLSVLFMQNRFITDEINIDNYQELKRLFLKHLLLTTRNVIFKIVVFINLKLFLFRKASWIQKVWMWKKIRGDQSTDQTFAYVAWSSIYTAV